VRIYPHGPSFEVLQKSMAATSGRFVSDAAMTPALLSKKSSLFLQMNADAAIDCAAFSYAMEDSFDTVRNYLREACLCFARFLATNTPVSLSDYTQYLSAAALARSRDLTQELCALPRERYTHPDWKFDESFFMAAKFQVALTTGQSQTLSQDMPDALARAVRLPIAIKADLTVLLGLERAIHARDQAAFDMAVRARHESLAKGFRELRIRNLPAGLLDIRGLGLLRLARDAGLVYTEKSVYLPAELLEN
jgi:hypothetical protein